MEIRFPGNSHFMETRKYADMNRHMDLETPFSDEIGADEFLAGFMRPDVQLNSQEEELKYLKSAQAILSDEILTAYDFMNKHGILAAYKEQRG